MPAVLKTNPPLGLFMLRQRITRVQGAIIASAFRCLCCDHAKANVVVLGCDQSQWRHRIYDVEYDVGGHAPWKTRALRRVGRHVILPRRSWFTNAPIINSPAHARRWPWIIYLLIGKRDLCGNWEEHRPWVRHKKASVISTVNYQRKWSCQDSRQSRHLVAQFNIPVLLFIRWSNIGVISINQDLFYWHYYVNAWVIKLCHRPGAINPIWNDRKTRKVCILNGTIFTDQVRPFFPGACFSAFYWPPE